MTWKEALEINTFPDDSLRAADVWDEEFNCNYSADGTCLLEAEAFPSEVVVREGTKIICDDAFAYQEYMDDRCSIQNNLITVNRSNSRSVHR